MKHLVYLAGLFTAALTARADEKLPVLKVNGEVYSNVTVTKFTATDIYFTHARGMGNAKLKNLDAELQRRFHYDATNAVQVEKQQVQASVAYREKLAARKPAPRQVPDKEEPSSPPANEGDFVAPRLSARSIRGQPAPRFVVEKWLTAQPDTTGKFVLIDFWATWCGPCRALIPELDGFHAKYFNRLVVIGVSDETEAEVRRMKSPKMGYAVAIDTHRRMNDFLQISGIPHCILIDPQGVVRYEGHPGYLNEKRLEHFLDKYK